MLSNTLDFEPYRQALARDGAVQVPDVLQPDAAVALARCLRDEVPWTLAHREAGRSQTLDAASYAEMPAADYEALLRGAQARGREQFEFVYDSYMLVRARKEGRDPGLLLHVVLDFFNSMDFIEFARWFGGDPAIDAINAQATRYRPGHFLNEHDDHDAAEGRRFAYVLNLTDPAWAADWGGALRFPPWNGQAERRLLPRWNSLSIFRVPRPHEVLPVSAAAASSRLSITGWWLSGAVRTP